MRTYYTYILSNKSRTLYTGVTNDLVRRVAQHKAGLGGAFTARYRCAQLVWYESFANVDEAIAAEKRIKGWSRAKKIVLIESANPGWADLSADWYGGAERDRLLEDRAVRE